MSIYYKVMAEGSAGELWWWFKGCYPKVKRTIKIWCNELIFNLQPLIFIVFAEFQVYVLTGGVLCFRQLHHKSCFAVAVLHVMLKRWFAFSVNNLNILLEGLCKNLEYGKTVTLLWEVRLSSPGLRMLLATALRLMRGKIVGESIGIVEWYARHP